MQRLFENVREKCPKFHQSLARYPQLIDLTNLPKRVGRGKTATPLLPGNPVFMTTLFATTIPSMKFEIISVIIH